MNMDNEPVEKFLKSLSLPEYESQEHRRRLRGRVLARLEADRSARFGRGWKTAALLLGLLCAAGAATEVAKFAIEANRIRFEGRGDDGSYHFKTEPRTPDGDQNSGSSITSSGNGELDAAGIERLRMHFEEIEVLRQKEAGELAGATDVAVNGRFLLRTFQVSYVLADGRTKAMGEGDPDAAQSHPVARTEDEEWQIAALREQGRREVDMIIETEHSMASSGAR
jgi:hypothetical protein